MSNKDFLKGGEKDVKIIFIADIILNMILILYQRIVISELEEELHEVDKNPENNDY